MKKFIFALLGLCLLSAPSFADNNIKMVTYFPTPYASYENLGVTGTCDVGVLGNCTMDIEGGLNVFRNAADNRVLNTGSLLLRTGDLRLTTTNTNSAIYSKYLQVGTGDAGEGNLEFAHRVSVNTVVDNYILSMAARNKASLSGLTLYGSAFPVCDDSNHTISWKNLTVDGKSGVFLVCGSASAPEETEDECPSGKWLNSSGECVCILNKICSDGTTWNSDTCECEEDDDVNVGGEPVTMGRWSCAPASCKVSSPSGSCSSIGDSIKATGTSCIAICQCVKGIMANQ